MLNVLAWSYFRLVDCVAQYRAHIDTVRYFFAHVNNYFLGRNPIFCGQCRQSVGYFARAQMTYKKGPPVLNYWLFVGHIVNYLSICLAS